MRHPGLLVRLLLGTLILAAPALLNRQPLLYEDIFSYLRGPAVVLAQIGGPRFENPWSRVHNPDAAITAAQAPDPAAEAAPAPPATRYIEAGRSIYWGALAYLGWLTSGFWALILLQAAIIAWLLDLLLLRVLRLGPGWFFGALAALTVFSPLPYYVGFVMPDIFAGIAILGAALLAGAWAALRPGERALLALLVAFGVAAHASHLLTLALLLGACTLAALTGRMPAPRRAPLLTLAGCVALGLAAELAFGQAVRLVLHQTPLRLPHITAHLVELGPGLDYLRQHCGPDGPFVLCAYLDRLPMNWVRFLFDADPEKGAYGAADMATRYRISAEQMRFLFAVLAHDPAGTVLGLARDALLQVVTFDLSDIVYTRTRLDFFAQHFPPALADGASATRLQAQPWIAQAHTALSYLGAAAALGAGGLALLRPGEAARDPSWGMAVAIALVVLLGVVLNGLICGAIASPYGRFQARVIWLLPLVALALIGLRARAAAGGRAEAALRPA